MKIDLTPFRSISALLNAITETPDLNCRALSFYRGSTCNSTLSYPEYMAAVSRSATRLKSLGVQAGDHIGTLMPNRLETPITYLALMSVGAVAVPLNPAYTSRELSFVIEDSVIKGLILDRSMANSELLKSFARIGFIEYLAETSVSAVANTAPVVEIEPNHPAIMLYTSGTTAFPKGVVQTHANLISNAWSMVNALGIRAPNQYSIMPFYHSHAVGFGMMTCLLSHGHLIIGERMDPAAWKTVVRKEKVTVTSMVPNLLQLLTRTRVNADEVPDLRFVFVSAAPLPKSVALDFESQSGIRLAHAWGLSEFTNFATCLSPEMDSSLRRRLMFDHPTPCVGRALEGVDVEVVRFDGSEARPGELGELRVRGPSLMLRYQNNVNATLDVVRDGWLYTGDEGYFCLENGIKYFYITDRIKDVVSRSGEKISPTSIEVEITQYLPQFANRVVALGFPHNIYGEEIGLVVEAADFDAVRPSFQIALLKFPLRMRPKVLLYGSDIIQRTHTGKIQRRKLVPLFKEFENATAPLTIALAPKGV